MPVLANKRHELFAQAIAQGRSGTQAWLVVNPRATAKSASVTAARVLANASVAARVAELSARVAEKSEITAQMVLERAWLVANSDAKDRAQHLSIVAKAFPEFRDGPQVNVDARTLIVGEGRL